MKKKTSNGRESLIYENGQERCGGVVEALKSAMQGVGLITMLARIIQKVKKQNLPKKRAILKGQFASVVGRRAI